MRRKRRVAFQKHGLRNMLKDCTYSRGGRLVLESRVPNNASNSSSCSNNQNVAVVGGSAAGLFTASLLARKGVPVRVFERIETLEPAARTLIVTDRMKNLLGAAAERSIVNEIRRFELFTDGRSASVSLKHPDLVI